MSTSQNGYAPQGQMSPPLQQTVSYTSQTAPQTPTSQPQRPSARPSSKSGFSFHSHKSRGSSDAGKPKLDLHESPAEKRARRLSTKADPRMAMSEAEPSQLANDHSSSLQPLRSLQHKDQYGNPIADPDRSNPTRSRWERPLDTIRAFEAAIDGQYQRKTGPGSRPEADSRRTSYAGSTVAPMKQYQGNGYAGGRTGGGNNAVREGYDYNGRGQGQGYQSRPDSYYSNNDNNNGYYPNGQRFPHQGREQAPNRSYGGNGYQNGSPTGVYPPNGNPQSYETVTTASGSGSSSDRMQYGTDPSSENSSFDRVPTAQRPEYEQGYNGYQSGGQQQGYGNDYPQQQQQQYGGGSPSQAYQDNGYQDQGRPAPPSKADSGTARAPMRLGKTAPPSAPSRQQTEALDNYGAPVGKEEKKKSWLGRRFSKKP